MILITATITITTIITATIIITTIILVIISSSLSTVAIHHLALVFDRKAHSSCPTAIPAHPLSTPAGGTDSVKWLLSMFGSAVKSCFGMVFGSK